MIYKALEKIEKGEAGLMWTVERVDNTYRICYNGVCKALSQDMKYAYDLVNGLNRGK